MGAWKGWYATLDRGIVDDLTSEIDVKTPTLENRQLTATRCLTKEKWVETWTVGLITARYWTLKISKEMDIDIRSSLPESSYYSSCRCYYTIAQSVMNESNGSMLFVYGSINSLPAVLWSSSSHSFHDTPRRRKQPFYHSHRRRLIPHPPPRPDTFFHTPAAGCPHCLVIMATRCQDFRGLLRLWLP